LTASRPTSPVTIRPFHPADEGALIHLWRACGLTRPWNDPHRDIARKRAVQPELFLVALGEDELVGSLMGGYDGHRGWAYYLAVHPDHRRRGIARRMMATLESALLDMGCPKLNLMVRTDNTAAQGFYEGVGYARDAVATLSKRLIPDD
jgi:ribosomal protein S18 acetylase RimI-like enzyme